MSFVFTIHLLTNQDHLQITPLLLPKNVHFKRGEADPYRDGMGNRIATLLFYVSRSCTSFMRIPFAARREKRLQELGHRQ